MTKTTRNREIMRRYNAGESLSSIALSHDLTRERVRQIVAAHGGTPRRAMQANMHTAIAEAIQNENLSRNEVQRRFGVTDGIVNNAARKHGVKPRLKADTPELAQMADLVRAGTSMYRAAGCDPVVARRLDHYCRRHGIKSQHQSKNPNYRQQSVGA